MGFHPRLGVGPSTVRNRTVGQWDIGAAVQGLLEGNWRSSPAHPAKPARFLDPSPCLHQAADAEASLLCTNEIHVPFPPRGYFFPRVIDLLNWRGLLP